MDRHAAASGVGRVLATAEGGCGRRLPPPQPRSELRKDDTDLQRAVVRMDLGLGFLQASMAGVRCGWGPQEGHGRARLAG